MPTTGNSKRQCITDSGLVYLSEKVGNNYVDYFPLPSL